MITFFSENGNRNETTVGYTPINLTLTRRNTHVVRFELAGYRPFEIRITSGLSQFFISVTAGAVLGLVIGTIIDNQEPSNFNLVPQTLFVTMETLEGAGPPLIIKVDDSQFGQVRWIRVATSWPGKRQSPAD